MRDRLSVVSAVSALLPVRGRLWLALPLLFLLTSYAQAQTRIEQIRVWPSPLNTRIVFDLSGPVDHSLFELSNPDRVVIDIDRTTTSVSPADLDFDRSLADGIRLGQREDGSLRVVVDVGQPVRPRSFTLEPNDTYGHRLVLDLEQKAPVVRTLDQVAESNRDILIAIDAGHGGEDPGALGPDGLFEKNLVLAIARSMQRLVDATPGYRALLVREGDYYIALQDRAEIARQARADVFISIHADAFDQPQVNGASLYALSERGATSERAAYLAQKENRADLIGGVGELSIRDKDDMLASVLLDLSMTATLDSSLRLGSAIIPHMGGVTRMHKERVEQAGFVVLKSPDMPSLLIETGFISNPQEARRLANSGFQEELARAIFSGVRDYFESHPPDGTLIAARGGSLERDYVVQSGDTLSEIALRFGISTSSLVSYNNLTNSVIRVGQTLHIPSS